MATSANLVVGAPATIKIGAYGAAEGACVDLGATEGGLKWTFTPEFYFKKADQWLGEVGAVKIGEKSTVEVTLAEASLANVCYALGYPTTAVSGQTLNIGGNAVATERVVYINFNAVGSGSAKMTIYKCVSIGAVDFSMVKGDKSVVKLTLEILQDTSKSANQQMFDIVYSGTDVTAPTIAMTTPVNGGTVTKDTKGTVTLTFTETDNKIDEGTLIYGDADDATIRITNITVPATPALVAGSIAYDSATKVITFTPTNNWTASNTLIIEISTGVRDTAGNRLASTFYGGFTVTI
ncbi:hypothetical protein C0389_06825 [bacterium]|nr:hypothetical protein [bacterium]